MKILLTGGHGFIGSNFIIKALSANFDVLNLDKNSEDIYLRNNNIDHYKNSYKFLEVDILDKKSIYEIVDSYKPNFVVHFAAESHVDNSILDPELFLNTNIIGTYNLLRISDEFFKKSYTHQYKGMTILCPNPPELFLEHVYGTNWITPIKGDDDVDYMSQDVLNMNPFRFQVKRLFNRLKRLFL